MIDLLKMTEDEFRAQFKGSPVKRTKWGGLMRNVAVALASSGAPAAEAAPELTLDHPEDLVREQAAISLGIIRNRR